MLYHLASFIPCFKNFFSFILEKTLFRYVYDVTNVNIGKNKITKYFNFNIQSTSSPAHLFAINFSGDEVDIQSEDENYKCVYFSTEKHNY